MRKKSNPFKLDAEEIRTAYRRMTWKIWLYLKANPDILAVNNNREVLDEVAKIQTAIYQHEKEDFTYEQAFEIQDFVSDMMAKTDADDYYFEQDLLDLFRPGVAHDKGWSIKLYFELFFFSTIPEIYTKIVREMALDDEDKRGDL